MWHEVLDSGDHGGERRHPWRTIAVWGVVAALALGAIGALLGGALTTEGRPTNNPESERAVDARAQAFPGGSRATEAIVVRSQVHSGLAGFRQFVGTLADELRTLDGIEVPMESESAPVISRDGRAALGLLTVYDADYAGDVIATVREADAHPDSVTGEKTREHDFNQLSQDDLKSGELPVRAAAALIILLLVFGGVVAGLVPLLMAMFSIVVALGLTALVAQEFELSVFVVNMLTGMGLALGIDYALFVVSRYREERGRGRGAARCDLRFGSTASRAVLFSGTAFVIAMFGMLIVPSSIMRSLAVGAILVGAVSVAAALTLLPGAARSSGRPRRRAADSADRQPVDGEANPEGASGCHRAARAATAGLESRRVHRRPARAGVADSRHEGRHERRVDAARAVRVEAGIHRPRP